MDACIIASGPIDVSRTLARFHLWGEDPANRLSKDVFRRVVKVAARWRGYELRWAGEPDAARLRVSMPGARSARVLDPAVDEVTRICGLPLDLPAFYCAAAGDPVLAPLVPRLYGLRPTLAARPFEMLVGSVCAQQVNLNFAFTVRARLVRRFGVPVAVGGETVYAFPEPETLARASVSELRAMQFTRRKAEYIVGLAKRIVTGELDLAGLSALSNDEVIESLTTLRGFGRWTAEWFLARGLGRGDVCPAGDLGVRKAFGHFYNQGRPLAEEDIRRRAAAWGAHQNLAVHYLLAGQRLEHGAVGSRAAAVAGAAGGGP